MNSESVKFLTNDGQTVRIRKPLAEMMGAIVDMREAGTDFTEEIALEDISKMTLDKVIEFLEYQEQGNPFPEIEKPLRSNDMRDVTTEWYATFVDLDQESIFSIILAANFLNIPNLLHLSCAKVASIIKDRSIPEIRRFFNIENDFTPEEEAQIMEENRWAEESF
ncbi:hypothetical protein FGO68_gene11629 [Halteria grandinella]|uniref:SKP1 component dimerisation domain-containing protein n=1 Tax=Halteria grandinella TaxID=5974 RepID=A0A8J8NIL2_HALGN|nr:hypothetical protein FGO68_gene11629 [Halteria grandinella]